MQLWICPLIAFLLGSVPFGLMIAHLKGIDIRAHGSGNIGATNVLRVVGKKYGITCLILDAIKGYLPVVLAINLIQIDGRTVMPLLGFSDSLVLQLPAEQQFLGQSIHVLTALFAILGHNYSPWVGFKGGKGIATSAGALIGLMPFAVIILIIVWLITFFTTRYVAVASIAAAAFLPFITLWGSWHHGRLADGSWNKPLFFFTIVISILAIWKHRSNIERLRGGTEHRFERKGKA